ncbi:hypothetical protein SSX86_017243 [Deinandra increscens subsp. villosa]|uniref:S-protein homolog n=1 Tax=Deinandra increscens subsp. villosa TaxID=3103831 RepID=A0AAP0GU30_9ASTR
MTLFPITKHFFPLIIILVLTNLSVLTCGHVPGLTRANDYDYSRKPFGMLERFEVFITNVEVDNLMAHCRSNDDDLGDKKMGPNQYFHWRFRQNFLFTTEFWCTFRSMTLDGTRELKSITFDVFEGYIGAVQCGRGDPRNCYWLVKNNGFYVSPDNQRPFPFGWMKRRSW